MLTRAIGDGIELRLLEERHADDVFAAVERNRARLRKWLNWVDRTHSAEDILAYIRMARGQFAAGEALHLGIWEGACFIGGAGHHAIDPVSKNTSLGYWLDADAEGRGIVTRTCEALLDYLFGELRLHRVEIRCAAGNTRSCAVPERLGFTREAVLREAEWAEDRYNDLVVWSILDDEWAVRRPSSPPAAASRWRG